MHLHKWHTNTLFLSKLCKENGMTSEFNSEAFGEQNLLDKVLGVELFQILVMIFEA